MEADLPEEGILGADDRLVEGILVGAIWAGEDLPEEGTQVVARLESASKVRQGQELEIWFNSEYLHLFDPENGLSLLAE